MPNKVFKLGFIIGRFQHLTKGHMRMIDAGLSSCERLLLLVGSSQESGTVRNPFPLKTRMDVIRASYLEETWNGRLLLGHIDDMTNENDINPDWGRFVLKKVDMWSQHYSLEHDVDCMIFGNDEERMGWYDPKDVVGVSQIVIARPEDAISATKVRNMLVENDDIGWKLNVPDAIATTPWFRRIRSELLDIPYYKEMAKHE